MTILNFPFSLLTSYIFSFNERAMEEAQTFMIKLLPPRRKSVTHQQAYERMHRFLTFATRDDIDEALHGIRPHKRVRWLVNKFEEETHEHIPISKVYKIIRENAFLAKEDTEDTKLPDTKLSDIAARTCGAAETDTVGSTISEIPAVIKFDEE